MDRHHRARVADALFSLETVKTKSSAGELKLDLRHEPSGTDQNFLNPQDRGSLASMVEVAVTETVTHAAQWRAICCYLAPPRREIVWRTSSRKYERPMIDDEA